MEFIFVLLSHQIAEDQRHSGHVLNAMITVGSVGQFANLGDDANRRLMGGNDDPLDFMQAITHQRVQGHRRLTGCLGMELGGEADLEQHVFHHIAGERLREAEGTLVFRLERQILVGVAEQHIVETPLRRRQNTRNAHLATQGDIRQAYTAARGIPRRPGFA
ncbi:hypothetical protein D3C81_1034010 [compost metagenome]